MQNEINMAAQVQASSPVKCFSSQTSKVQQGSYLEELPDWSSDSDVPAPRLRMAAAPENICTSGCTLGMLERERERETLKRRREPTGEAF